MGPYCTTFNPGYDPSLPLYDPWPMYDAMRAANGGTDEPAWSPWSEERKPAAPTGEKAIQPVKPYRDVIFIGQEDGKLKQILDAQGVEFSLRTTAPQHSLYIIDGSTLPGEAQKKALQQDLAKGADLWIWGITPPSDTGCLQPAVAVTCVPGETGNILLPSGTKILDGGITELRLLLLRDTEESRFGVWTLGPVGSGRRGVVKCLPYRLAQVEQASRRVENSCGIAE